MYNCSTLFCFFNLDVIYGTWNYKIVLGLNRTTTNVV
jgi:hypothetical protein